MNPSPFGSTAECQRIETPPGLIASVPALLGFYPAESLVLVSLRQQRDPGRIALILRVDLPPPGDQPVVTAELATHLAAYGCTDAAVIVVAAGEGDPTPPHAGLVSHLRKQCRARGTSVRTALWTPEIAEGRPWRCYDGCDCSGQLPDPAATVVAAASVAAGTIIYPDRAALQRTVAAPDPRTARRRSRLLDARIDAISSDAPDEGAAGLPAFQLLEHWVAAAEAGPPRFTDRDVVDLCLALADPIVRDACIGFGWSARAEAAERLWTALVAQSPDPEAAEPAVLLAACALVRRDGAVIGVALERAQRAWPGHRLSNLIDSALRSGQPPERIEGWLAEGAELARRELAGEGAGQ
jgi:uncharacterized protein DUF4192